MRKFLLLLVLTISVLNAFTQNFSNRGREFWIPYSYHVGMNAGGAPTMTLHISSDVNTSYIVEAYGGAVISSGNITANVVTNVTIPNSYFINKDGLFNNRAIHVTAAKPIVVYSFITRAQASAATLCLPSTVLGREYYAMSFNQKSNENESNSFITIIAVEDNTSIEIIPTGLTVGGWQPGSVNLVTLNKGQIYQVLGATSGNYGVDLSGTSVKSIATSTSSCKRIAVFSGTGKILIGEPPCNTGADNLYQQLYPTASWGKKYLTVPSNNNPYNYYRVIRASATTTVKVNGAVIPNTLFFNGYYEFFNNTQNLIEGDGPISVTQYFTSQSCDNNGSPYDPDMIVLNPVEQNISDVTLISSNKLTGIAQHHLHIIMTNKGTSISSFRFDGNPVSASLWKPHPQDPEYSYLYLSNISQTSHTLRSDSGFNALAYGYSSYETYGYSAGTNVKDLYQQVGITNPNSIEAVPSACIGNEFKFKLSLPYQPESIYWDLAPTFPPITSNTADPSIPLPFDSTTFVNGKQLWWYSLPTPYTYNTIGTYSIVVTAYASNADGCGNEQQLFFDLEINPIPVADFTFTTPKCVAEPVSFTDVITSNKTIYKWMWNFGDPVSGTDNISGDKTPVHKFSAPGTYKVTLSAINAGGCTSNTIEKEIIIAPLPTATIATSAISICENEASPTITFTGAGGTAPYVFNYTINGTAQPSITTTTGNSITVSVPTNAVGNFRYALTSVANAGSTLCSQNQTQFVDVRINPLPSATITGTTAVCQNGPSPNIVFSGSDATAPYTFTYTINGGAPLTITTTTGNSVSLPAPTGAFGTFTYNLTSVKESSSLACSKTITSTPITITVNQLPTATISASTEVCHNSPSTNVVLTGSGGLAPYTFTYTINGGAPQTIVTTTGNSVSIPISTSNVGTTTYAITNIKESSSTTCSNVVTGVTSTVKVIALPTATLTGTVNICENATSPVVTFTGAGSTIPYTFTYTINGGAPLNVTTTTGSSVTVAVPTNTPGTFVYNLISVKEGSAITCSNNVTGQSATVLVRPLPVATISTSSAVCQNSGPVTVTFTGGVGTSPYTFTYTVNGGAPQTITTTTGNSVSITQPSTTAGVTTYAITNVRDASANLCAQPINNQSSTVTVVALPNATISAAVPEICLNATAPIVTFTGSGGVAPYTFTYRINAGAIQTITTTAGSNTVTVPVPTNVAGTFIYTLTNVSESSPTTCAKVITGATASVVVNRLPTANFSNTLPTCETKLISFNAAPSIANSGVINSWTWDFGDPSSGVNNTSNLSNPDHTFSAVGNYIISLTVKTDKGCESMVFQKTINVNSLPTTDFTIPEICFRDTYAQFTDQSTVNAPSTITSWLWDFGDAANSTPGNPNTSTQRNGRHKFSTPGLYNITFTAITNTGCRTTISKQIMVNGDGPLAEFLPSTTEKFCGNDSIAIQNKSTVDIGILTKLEITWDVANAPNVVQTVLHPEFDKIFRHKYPDFQSPVSKQITIRIRAYSGTVCFNDKFRTITVYASPKVQFGALPNTCLNDAPFLLTQAKESGTVPGVGVYSGNGVNFISTGVYQFDGALAGEGIHDIKYVYTANGGGCVDSATQKIEVFPNPIVDVGPDATILLGGSTTFQPIVSGNNLSYLWTENIYLNNNAIKSPVASPVEDRQYKLTVTARGGCKASDSLVVKVLFAPKIPNTFTPNNDGINDFWRIEYLDTYPNCRVQVFTRTGAKIFESRGYKKPWDGNVNGKSVPTDTYYYIIEPENGRKPITGYVTIVK